MNYNFVTYYFVNESHFQIVEHSKPIFTKLSSNLQILCNLHPHDPQPLNKREIGLNQLHTVEALSWNTVEDQPFKFKM